MPTRANGLAVMAKAPVAGAVKTRLVPPLTLEQAAELSKALLIDQLEHLAAIRDAGLYLAFAPADAAAMMASLSPPGFSLFPQQGDDLGTRMDQCLRELGRRGHRRALLIGADLPPVPLGFFAQAFEFLAVDRHRVILGPSRDGGYYLVGMNRPTPEIFSGMDWSHERVLAQTRARLAHLGIESLLLPPWFDIDRQEDVEALRALDDPAVVAAMKRSRDVLERLIRGNAASQSDAPLSPARRIK